MHRHEGGYDLYHRLKEAREAAASPPPEEPTRAPADGAPRKKREERRLSYKEQRELEQVERAIMQAEAEVARLEQALSDPALYADTPDQVAAVTAAFRDAGAKVESLYARWAELEELAAG